MALTVTCSDALEAPEPLRSTSARLLSEYLQTVALTTAPGEPAPHETVSKG